MTRFSRSIRHLATYKNIRHYRGHGIHSPFVYNLVRNVVMEHRVISDDKKIYDAMLEQKLPSKASAQLQNLYNYLSYKDNSIIHAGNLPDTYDPDILYFISADTREQAMETVISGVRSVKGTVVVLYPRQSRSRMRFLNTLMSDQDFLSVDNRRFLILFFSNKLPRQHYKL